MISRSEKQMMNLIEQVALNNPLVRVVLLEGSRSNPTIKKDIFQDYDIVYGVSTMAPFLSDPSWIDVFGKRMITQLPEDMELYPPDPDLENAYSYLMQFMDGNRIDLVLIPMEHLRRFAKDSLCQLILDKDSFFASSPLSAPSDRSYWVTQPSARAFGDCCNEFWYTIAGLAKGLWREEVPLVKGLFHQVIQDALRQMLDWYIGCRHAFAVNPGKFGKYYERYLEPDVYHRFLATYSVGDLTATWEAVYRCMDLFEEVATQVGNYLDYPYAVEEAHDVRAYVEHVHRLPKDAQRIY